jgi:hypothetical protein
MIRIKRFIVALFSSVLIGLLSFSCRHEAKTEFNERALTRQDSMTMKYIAKVFGLEGSKYWPQKFEYYINQQRHPSKALIINPGNYKLTPYYFGDGQDYNEFTVKVTSANDSILGFFSFSDELYYMYNSKKAWINKSDRKIERENRVVDDSKLRSRLNLEKNLNDLIRSLGYQNDRYAIINLLDGLFHDCLSIQKASYQQIDRILEDLKNLDDKGQFKKEDQEYKYLRQQMNTPAICLQAKEGIHGFWILKIEKIGLVYKVKTRFVGDTFYYNIYI